MSPGGDEINNGNEYADATSTDDHSCKVHDETRATLISIFVPILGLELIPVQMYK